MADESLREIAARLIRAHRERRDAEKFGALVDETAASNPDQVVPTEPPLFDGIDREFLRQCGVDA